MSAPSRRDAQEAWKCAPRRGETLRRPGNERPVEARRSGMIGAAGRGRYPGHWDRGKTEGKLRVLETRQYMLGDICQKTR